MPVATSAFDSVRRPTEPPAEEIRAALERMLDSPGLACSPRRKAMLRFLVEEGLAGRGDRLKGFAIAVAVFGRDESFDSQSDPIVRLEARHLRRDLDGYYVAAGAADPVRISIPKGGYAPHFAWRAEAAAPPPEAPGSGTAPPPAGAQPRSRPGAPVLLAAALAPLLAAGLLGLTLLRPGTRETATGARGPAVIVLPFEAQSAGEEDRFLADGVTQEVISDLMRFAHFRVYSAPASFRQDAVADPHALWSDLGVDYVVKGGLRSDGDRVRLTAQLFNAETGQALWSETYDRDLSARALLEIQGDLAANVATELGQPYGAVQADMLRRLPAEAGPSLPSYSCVLRAYAYRRTFDDALYAPTLACLEAATRRDPAYPAAWAMLGWLKMDGVRFHLVPSAEETAQMAAALAAAERAVTLDPESVLGLQAKSAVLHYAGRFDESMRVQQQALAVNPNDPDTLAQLGWRLAARGDFRTGVPYIEQAIDRTLNPPGWYFHLLAVDRYLKGDYGGMLDMASRGAPGRSGVSWAFVAIAKGALGDRAGAQEAFAQMAVISPELAADPAAEFRMHGGTPETIAALMEGMRKAGWTPPPASGADAPAKAGAP